MHTRTAVEDSTSDLARGAWPASRPAGSDPHVQPNGGTAAAADAAAIRIAQLEQQCSRLAHELSSVACDADRRDQEYRTQIEALVRRLHECESELAEREGRLASVAQAYDALRSQVENGSVPATAAAEVYRRELRRNAEVAVSLRKRLEERGRALDVAGEQIAALHAERARLIDTVNERTQQVIQLMAQLTRGEVRDGFGIELRGDLGRLRDETLAAAQAEDARIGWNTRGSQEPTVVLNAAPAGGLSQTAAAAAGSTAPRAAGAEARGPRLRRYLLPVAPDVDPPFELTGPRSYVGRGVEADVCLTHPTISRLHGVLYRIGGCTIVEDARSSNGVFVNQERVQQAVLKDGDIVSFGHVAFWFRLTISGA